MTVIPQVTFRFYAELNDFLPVPQRHARFPHDLREPTPVGDVIGSLGVPVSEVDLVLVNDSSVGIAHVVQGGDHISVFPMFESFDISPIVKVRACPLRNTRFLVANGLDGLAGDLRLLGFDTRHAGHWHGDELAASPTEAHRILLTRDSAALEHGDITHAYRVRALQPRSQVIEVIRRFQLESQSAPLARCAYCNTRLRTHTTQSPTTSDTAPGPLARCPSCHRPHATPAQRARVRLLTELIPDAARTPACVKEMSDFDAN